MNATIGTLVEGVQRVWSEAAAVVLGHCGVSAGYYFGFFGLPQLLQQAGKYDAGVVGLLMLPLAALAVLARRADS